MTMLTAKRIAMALVETIYETKAEIVEGHAYARMMGQCDLATFETAVAMAVGTGLIAKRGHVLRGTEELFAIKVDAAIAKATNSQGKP
jgi:hypothetical protein